MKTQNSIIATVTVITVLVLALFSSFTASANVYEDRLKEAFDGIISTVSIENLSQMHTTYTDPETGIKEGQLDAFKFAIDRNDIDLINNVKRVYDQIGDDVDNELISRSELYTLWYTNHDNSLSGYRLYYSPVDAIIVGLACDYCYTVGFLSPGDTKHRTTYTIEWDENGEGDSITGRLVTTYAPIIPKVTDGKRISSVVMSLDDYDDYDKYMEQFQAGMEKYQEGMEKYRSAMEKAQGSLEKAQGALSGLSDGKGHSYSFSSSSSSSSKNNSKGWMKKLLFYVDKVQQSGNRHLYLSQLYDLCKDTDGLDQTDLKIGMQQLASVYKQLKAKNKLKENELLFLESMVDLLQSKIKN